jgi:molybdopterin converting factor small subunit
MTITVLFFAMLRAAAGADKASLQVAPGSSARDAAHQAQARWPGLDGWLSCSRLAVNGAYAGDELAIIPPVSGG